MTLEKQRDTYLARFEYYRSRFSARDVRPSFHIQSQQSPLGPVASLRRGKTSENESQFVWYIFVQLLRKRTSGSYLHRSVKGYYRGWRYSNVQPSSPVGRVGKVTEYGFSKFKQDFL
jgi:hypothetical protein